MCAWHDGIARFRRIVLGGFFVAMFLALAGCSTAGRTGLFAAKGESSPLHYLTTNEEIEAEIHRKGLVFLGFCQHHCGVCQMVRPRVERLARDYGDRARFVSINVDEHREPIMVYKVYKTPDLRLYRDGRQIAHWTGFTDYDKLEKALKEALRG